MKHLTALAAGFFAGSLFLTPAQGQKQQHSKNTLYAAIAYHAESGAVGWAADRRTSRDARVEALKQCGNERCVVVATVARDCAALARTAKKYSVQKGATRQEAETKALGKCGAGCEIAAWACTR